MAMTQPLVGAAPPTAVEVSNPTRERILVATAEVMGRNGMTKLSLSEVALQAGLSRPTLYRWFGSKKDLLDAYVTWERALWERAISAATAGLAQGERLDAMLCVIAKGQQAYPGLRMIDIEPAEVIRRLSEFIPLMREGFERLMPGPDGAEAAATVVRVTISHYLVRSDDTDDFLAQLRHAAGLRNRSGRPAATAGP